jgi:NADH-quinone oxidoreductase subunit A
VLDQYFGDYITVLVFMAVGALIVGGALLASALLRPNNPSQTKSEIYECGIDPVGGGWNQTHIRYYIFALLFLIFDVEALFIFPWAVKVEDFASPASGLGGFILVEMVIFIVILLLGLVYAIRKGVLRWE